MIWKVSGTTPDQYVLKTCDPLQGPIKNPTRKNIWAQVGANKDRTAGTEPPPAIFYKPSTEAAQQIPRKDFLTPMNGTSALRRLYSCKKNKNRIWKALKTPTTHPHGKFLPEHKPLCNT
jgi:hypothetical protein